MEQYIKNCFISDKSIVIIGGGPSGIVACKYLGKKHNILCIESKDELGGQWYLEKTTESSHPDLQNHAFYKEYGCLQSSCYDGLVLNGLKITQVFRGFPAKKERDEFMSLEQFQQYQLDYASHFGVRKYVKFNSVVTSVRLTKNLTEEERLRFGNPTKCFVIEICSTQDHTKENMYVQADYVLACNGHHTKPNYPKIKNEQLFNGSIIHSHNFRENMFKYHNQHLVMLGASISGQDLQCVLLKNSDFKPKRITLIGHKDLIDPLRKSESWQKELQDGTLVLKYGTIKSYLEQNSLILGDDEVIHDVDHVIYCTGYQYSFPFLDKSSEIDHIIEYTNKDRTVIGPLYKRTFCINEPNFIFVNLMQTSFLTIMEIERSVMIADRYIDGYIELPPKDVMLSSYKKDYEETLKYHPNGRYYLKTVYDLDGYNDFVYFEEMREFSGIPADKEFELFYKNYIYPFYVKFFEKGEYHTLKQQKFEHYNEIIHPEISLKEGYF